MRIHEQFRFLFTDNSSGLDVGNFQVILLLLLLLLHRRRRQVGCILRRRNNVNSILLSDDGSASRPLIESLSRLSGTY
jgi:hypothetical protein